MFCQLKDFFKNLNIWEAFLTFIITVISLYVIVVPVLPDLNINVLQSNLSNVSKDSVNKDIVIIYKTIKTTDDIVPVECRSVLPVVYKNTVSLKNLPVKLRKKKFIDLVLPSILIANYKIRKLRKKIIQIDSKLEAGEKLTNQEKELLSKLLDKYKSSSIKELLIKINTHKPSLILAQAAIESGWGTSRFFVEANNIFGMWNFNKKQTLKIKAKKSNVYLKKYPDILSSIEDYYYSINVSWAYKNFRYVRLTTKDSLKLANYLDKYSILRKTYVRRIKTIIQHNNLTYYDSCRLHPDYLGK